jgi:hypothetical protein
LKTKIPETKDTRAALRRDIPACECGTDQEDQQQRTRGARSNQFGQPSSNKPDPRRSFVIGRHTAFTCKGKAVDLVTIGRELNVRYVLEGLRPAQR